MPPARLSEGWAVCCHQQGTASKVIQDYFRKSLLGCFSSRFWRCFSLPSPAGRIKQLIELDYLSTGSVRLFVLDEADKLLEEGSFQEQIK